MPIPVRSPTTTCSPTVATPWSSTRGGATSPTTPWPGWAGAEPHERSESEPMTSALTSSPSRPVFTDAQWERFRGYGIQESVAPGTWLFRAGDASCDMLLVENGAIDIVRARTAD